MKQSLNGAFAQHYAKLFQVLMSQPKDKAAWSNFIEGMNRMCRIYDEIEKKEGPQWGP